MLRSPIAGIKGKILFSIAIALLPVVAVTMYFATVDSRSYVIAWLLVAYLLAIMLTWLVLDRTLLRSLGDLLETARLIHAGDLRAHVRLKPGNDELGQLAATIDQMATALEVRKTEQQETEQALKLLSQMSQLLLVSENLDEAAGITAKFTRQFFSGSSGALYTRQSGNEMFGAIAHWGEIPPQDNSFAFEDCWALRQSKAYVLDTDHPGLRCRHVSDASNYLCIPILTQGELTGLMHLRSPMRIADIQKKHAIDMVQLAIAIAEQTGLALTDLQLRQSLHEQAIRDPLTGLYNRRQMEKMLDREEARAMRQNSSFGMMMVDIDHFKKVNDTYGHEAGDQVLQLLARLLEAHVREWDLVCRFGGEEFVVVLPDTDLEASRTRAEALREDASRMKIEYGGQIIGPVTISAGVACFPEHGATWQEVLQAADTSLYRAKAAGRNRVMTAAATVTTQPLP